MQPNNRRAGRFARLNLESLEGRALPSATLPAPALGPALVRTAAVQQTANYTYSWVIGPSAVLTGTNSSTGNGRSTGSVMIARYRGATRTDKLGSTTAVPVALVTSSSSALPSKPDHYNTPFTVSLKLKDNVSGASTTVTFSGTLNGALAWNHSALTMTFKTPLTRQVKLGSHTYTVTLKAGALHVPAPGASPALLGATIAVK